MRAKWVSLAAGCAVAGVLLAGSSRWPATLAEQGVQGGGTATQAAFLHNGATVLFQGDSITDGGRQRSGNDYNHLMGQDYAYILAAELGDRFAERNVTFLNRGISGDRVKDLAARWQVDALDLHPQILSILVGINDTLATGDRAESAGEFERIYDGLLAQTVAALPGVHIVLGEPFELPVGKHQATYAADRAELRKRQDAVQRLAAKYHLPLIPYQEVFDAACARAPAEHWIWDGVHPTYAGHALMAGAWLRTVEAAWPN